MEELISVIEVDGEGNILEYYLMSDEEINEAIAKGRHIITKDWGDKRMFKPRYDFSTNQWIESLTDEEIEELEERNKHEIRLSDSELNAVAIMELGKLIMDGGV